MGSDESHFNVSLIVRDKVTRQCPQTTTLEEKGELKRIRTEYCSIFFPIPPDSFVSSLAFYGLGLNGGSLGGSIYVNFRLSGVMELFACVLCHGLLDCMGRRPLISALMLLAGLACTSTIFTTLYVPRCKWSESLGNHDCVGHGPLSSTFTMPWPACTCLYLHHLHHPLRPRPLPRFQGFIELSRFYWAFGPWGLESEVTFAHDIPMNKYMRSTNK